MASIPNDVVPDAIITIVIDAFTAAWSPPTPGQPSFTVQNCLPQAFIPVINTPAQGRIAVVQPSGTQPGQSYVPGSITISGSGALTLCFKVISGVGSGAVNYTECGLVFGWLATPKRTQIDPGGRDAFPNFVSSDRGLIVTDDGGFAATYEFMLVIQNPAGGVAVVDPRITNSS